MNVFSLQVCTLAQKQHDVVATWQLRALRWTSGEIQAGLKGLRRVHRGVWALGDVTELGWYMAAALAMGPTGVVSHLSALMLMGLRPYRPRDIDVSHQGGGRVRRAGLQVHRRGEIDAGTWAGIPVTTPTQSLLDADLPPHERYRALEQAERQRIALTLPVDEVVRLRQAVTGSTRSDTEAQFLWLLHADRRPIPLVNQILNGYETDFHWPQLRLVVEVDGFEHHRDKPNFDSDRHRGLVHKRAGYEVVRISADHVYDRPRLILDALRECGVRA